ncbi:hypothetical protein RDI58_028895 [Solanum bulbocastanum]|uniref:Uncharacterized protein n=1 Tax=Solanum bulbocastanum TaxID=147425 RepID=A0AAN8SVT9_SOLBU
MSVAQTVIQKRVANENTHLLNWKVICN